MVDLFAGQTDLGSFSSTPTKQSLLYRCKSVISTFHNENDSWYTISNLTSTSCTLSATDRNPFYNSSVNLNYTIDTKLELAAIFSPNLLETGNYRHEVFISPKTTNLILLKNQIIEYFYNQGIDNRFTANQITAMYKTYGGDYGKGVVTLNVTNSLTLNGMVDIPYTNAFTPNYATSNISNPPFVTESNGGYLGMGAWCGLTNFVGNNNSYYWQIDMGTSYLLKMYGFGERITQLPHSYAQAARAWTLSASNDANNWITIDTKSNQVWPNSDNLDGQNIKYFPISLSTSYRFFRINFSGSVSDNRVSFSKICFFADI